MSNPSSIAPSDMADFQTAVGAVLVQLYNGWPEPISIDRAAVARTLTRTEDLSTATLPSGMPLDEFLEQVISWLDDKGLTAHEGTTPWDRAGLSGKGVLALNKSRRGSNVTFGQQLSEAASKGTWCPHELGDFFDGLFGRSPKSTNSAYKLRDAPSSEQANSSA